MNYRHHFHAGNFADVMKHVLLLQLLNRLNAKDKPYRYIDTHGGAGKYDLSQAPAQKSGEFLTGIHRLVQLSDMEKRQAPEAIQQYLKLVEELRAQEGKEVIRALRGLLCKVCVKLIRLQYLKCSVMYFSNYAITFMINVRACMSVMHMKACLP